MTRIKEGVEIDHLDFLEIQPGEKGVISLLMKIMNKIRSIKKYYQNELEHWLCNTPVHISIILPFSYKLH